MIQVQKVYKSFNGETVLKGIDLDVQDSETLVILGPSGQGKTVFIKTLVRLLDPDSGSIVYDGQEIVNLSQKKLARFQEQIGFVFQNSALFDFFDVQANLSLYLKMHKHLTKDKIWEQVNHAIQFVGLDEEVLDKYPEELSGGMRKRVAIARAMIKRPRYMFYDEPTTGLDKRNAEKVSELIQMLKGQISVTSIVVTHDIHLMQEVADRVALLKDGDIVFVGKKSDISNEILKSLYEMRGDYEL
jgi:phospholipid/cholesterol/gamma-HCH transport system ATP-binding protein